MNSDFRLRVTRWERVGLRVVLYGILGLSMCAYLRNTVSESPDAEFRFRCALVFVVAVGSLAVSSRVGDGARGG